MSQITPEQTKHWVLERRISGCLGLLYFVQRDMKQILHITTKIDWEKAKKAGVYSAPSLEKAGFIHCSLAQQIPPVANYNFKGQQELIILEIDEYKLKYDVKYEDLWNEGQLYPHIYGPINIDAVVRTVPFPPEPDGTFKLPSSLE